MPPLFVRIAAAVLLLIATGSPGLAQKLKGPMSDPLPFADVENLGLPGALWCFEPQGDTCMFISVSEGVKKGYMAYTVTELWDEQTILTVHSGAELDEAGRLCETGLEFIDTAELTDLQGNVRSPAEHEAVIAELHELWAGAEERYDCFGYEWHPDGTPGLMLQWRLDADGNPVADSSYAFTMNWAADAREQVTLRPLD